MSKRKQQGPRRIRTKRGYRYVDAKGKSISYETYRTYRTLNKQAKQESSKSKGAVSSWRKRRQRLFSNLGQNVPSRKGQSSKARLDLFSRLVASGNVPPEDAVDVAVDPTNEDRAIIRRYWRFEGIEAEDTVKDLLLLLRDLDFQGGTHVTVGTGFGKNSTWISSPQDVPIRTKRWLDIWQSRASAQPILEQLEAGGTVWFELYTDELATKRGDNVKSAKLGQSKRTKRTSRSKKRTTPVRQQKRSSGRKSSPKGRSKGNKPRVQGKRKSARKGKVGR